MPGIDGGSGCFGKDIWRRQGIVGRDEQSKAQAAHQTRGRADFHFPGIPYFQPLMHSIHPIHKKYHR